MKLLTLFFTLLFTLTLSATTLKLDTKASKLTWYGKKVTGGHDGHLSIKSGEVKFEKENLVGGEFILDMNTITNNDVESPEWKAKLVDHLKSDDFFNVKKFPTAKFTIKKAEKEKGDTFKITGDLTVKGITHSINFPAKITGSGNIRVADATVKIDRLKWDIKYNSGKFFDAKKLGDKLIYDEIELKMNLKTAPAKIQKKS